MTKKPSPQMQFIARKISKLEFENKATKEDLLVWTKNMEKLATKVSKLMKTTKKLEKELALAKMQRTVLKKEVKSLKDTNHTQEAKILQLETTINNLTSNNHNISSQFVTAKRVPGLSILSSNMANLNSQWEGIKKELHK